MDGTRIAESRGVATGEDALESVRSSSSGSRRPSECAMSSKVVRSKTAASTAPHARRRTERLLESWFALGTSAWTTCDQAYWQRESSQNRNLDLGLKRCLVEGLIPDTGTKDTTTLNPSRGKDRLALGLQICWPIWSGHKILGCVSQIGRGELARSPPYHLMDQNECHAFG